MHVCIGNGRFVSFWIVIEEMLTKLRSFAVEGGCFRGGRIHGRKVKIAQRLELFLEII